MSDTALNIKFIQARELLVTAQLMATHGQQKIVTDAFNQLDVLVKGIRLDCDTLLTEMIDGSTKKTDERKGETDQGRNQDAKGQPGRKAKPKGR